MGLTNCTGGSKTEGQGLCFFRREARLVLAYSLDEVQVYFSESVILEPSIKERRQHFRILLMLTHCSLCLQELPVLHVFSVREITAEDGELEGAGTVGHRDQALRSWGRCLCGGKIVLSLFQLLPYCRLPH